MPENGSVEKKKKKDVCMYGYILIFVIFPPKLEPIKADSLGVKLQGWAKSEKLIDDVG